MFANLLPFRRRPAQSDPESLFIREVRFSRPMHRSRRSEVLLVVGWILVALKSWGTFWLVEHYAMPFNAWWIVGPTWAAAALCTWVYVRRN